MSQQRTLVDRSDALGIVRSVLRLAQREWLLAKEEISENLERAGVAVAVLVAGAALAILSIAALLWAAVAGLTAAGLAPWLSALILAGALAFIGGGMLIWALSNLKAKSLAPTRSMANVQKDLHVLKEVFDG